MELKLIDEGLDIEKKANETVLKKFLYVHLDLVSREFKQGQQKLHSKI